MQVQNIKLVQNASCKGKRQINFFPKYVCCKHIQLFMFFTIRSHFQRLILEAPLENRT